MFLWLNQTEPEDRMTEQSHESAEPNPREIARSTFEGNPSLSLDDMEACYAYVNLLARASAYRCFQIKLNPEDLAHEAILRIQAKWQQLRSSDPAAIEAWLRSVVSSVFHDLADRAWAGKRDIGKERSLDAALDESSARLEAFLPANTSTPSKAAVRHERALALAQALGKLPADQRMAIELHHFSGLSLDETAGQMNRSFASVAGLLRRGLKTLKDILRDTE
jgi:RNA polymerase sigma-70 factor (ECF subfamily)